MMKKFAVFVILIALLSAAFAACDNGSAGNSADDPIPGNNGNDLLPKLSGSITIDKMNPKLGDLLNAKYTGNGSGTASWFWLADNVVIFGAYSNTYTVAYADMGKTLKAQVSFSNQSGSITSSQTAEVFDTRPALSGTVTINNTYPVAGDSLTASYTSGNGTGTAFWQWLRDDIIIPNSYSSSYTVVNADMGKTLKAQVSFPDFKGVVSSWPTAPIPDTRPLITGAVNLNNMTPKVGDTITATYASGNGSGIPSWEWLRNYVPIPNATRQSYTVTAADLGYAIWARISYSNQSGYVQSAAVLVSN